jgi:hypothetical protein
MRQSAFNWGLWGVTFVAAVVLTATCLTAGLICESSTDGQGLYTYTFTNDATIVVWGFDDGDAIAIPSYGVKQVFAPAAWTTAVNEVGYITFHHTNGTYFVEDTPLTFQIESHFIQSITYTSTVPSDFFPSGTAGDTAYYKAGHGYAATGLQRFDILGPLPTPAFGTNTLVGDLLTLNMVGLAGDTCIVEQASTPTNEVWNTFTNFPITSYSTNITYTIPQGTNSGFFKYRCVK